MKLGESFDQVLAAAKTGADWAWAKLFRTVAGQVTGYLRSQGVSDPENLSGEVFLNLARAIQNFEGDERAFRSWVFVIAHRRLIDDRRAKGRRPVETDFLEETIGQLDGGNVEGEAIERLTTAELNEIFATLTDGQREVLALRVIAALTLEETAEIVGKSVGAVKALQRRALEGIRRVFDAKGVTL